jgi:hypothetical protein
MPVPHGDQPAYRASHCRGKAPGLHENAFRQFLVGFRSLCGGCFPGCDSLQDDIGQSVDRKVLLGMRTCRGQYFHRAFRSNRLYLRWDETCRVCA